MIISNNLPALNSHLRLKNINSAVGKNTEKLASGLRISKASDDAAGLSISEKMRAQIRGLNQARKNTQDGISLIQVAEGALNEIHSIIHRMRELAVQAASDTYTAMDRYQIQGEVDQLAEEVTRIANNTHFNTHVLLDGTFDGTFQIGANEGQNVALQINKLDANALGIFNPVYESKLITPFKGLYVRSMTGNSVTLRHDQTNYSPDYPGIPRTYAVLNENRDTITLFPRQLKGLSMVEKLWQQTMKY